MAKKPPFKGGKGGKGRPDHKPMPKKGKGGKHK